MFLRNVGHRQIFRSKVCCYYFARLLSDLCTSRSKFLTLRSPLQGVILDFDMITPVIFISSG
jgi:hypothetical protein